MGQVSDFIEDTHSPSPFESTTQRLLQRDVEEALSVLPERQRHILLLRFGLDGNDSHTLEEIALVFGLSRERIRQLEKEALHRLRRLKETRNLHEYLG